MTRKDIKQICFILAAIVVIIFAIYGCYWVAKNVSYSIFYKDMVRATIIEMVKKESLK